MGGSTTLSGRFHGSRPCEQSGLRVERGVSQDLVQQVGEYLAKGQVDTRAPSRICGRDRHSFSGELNVVATVSKKGAMWLSSQFVGNDRLLHRRIMKLNFIRCLIDGGLTDLHHPEYCNLDFVSNAPLADEYRQMAKSIGEFLVTCRRS